MRERRNDPEIMKDHAIACGIQLGSISSLRCQKSRSSRPVGSRCKAMFRGRIGLLGSRSARLRPLGLRRGSLRYEGLAEPKLAPPAKAGGARRDRTDDLMLAKHALSQLSYGPVTRRRMLLRQIVKTTPARLRPSGLRRARFASIPMIISCGTDAVACHAKPKAKRGGPGKT